jgi:hypothetical protein
MPGTRPSIRDEPIAPVGRLAAFVTLGCLLATAITYAIVAARAFACTRRCAVRPAVGGLILMLALALSIVALLVGINVGRRPVDPAGGGGWSYGLGVIFALGVLAAVTRIPDLTCPAGTVLSAFGYCSGPHDRRIDVASWIWLKNAVAIGAVVLGAAVISRRRLIAITLPLAAVVWLIGTGLFLRTVLL